MSFKNYPEPGVLVANDRVESRKAAVPASCEHYAGANDEGYGLVLR